MHSQNTDKNNKFWNFVCCCCFFTRKQQSCHNLCATSCGVRFVQFMALAFTLNNSDREFWDNVNRKPLTTRFGVE